MTDRRIDIETLIDQVDEITHPNGYLDRLIALLPEQSETGPHEYQRRGKLAASPAPWNDEVAGLLFEIHAGARRHEANLIYLLHGGKKFRVGTDSNTVLALKAIPELVRLADDRQHTAASDPRLGYVTARIVRDLTRWPQSARRIFDEARGDEIRNTKAPGRLTCPHCNRALILKAGWQYEQKQHVWCLRCPSTVTEEQKRPSDLSWPADAWVAVLQADTQQAEGA